MIAGPGVAVAALARMTSVAALLMLLLGMQAAPPRAEGEPGGPARLVVAHTYGFNFGFSPIPSGEVSLFLGVSLPRRTRRPDHWTAIGYQGTLSLGAADIWWTGPWAGQASMLTHRHHLAVHGVAGAEARLAYGASVGPVFNVPGLDGEARLGYVFTQNPGTLIRGVFGGQLRISGVFGEAPIPQVGAFIGFTRAPRPPWPPRPDAPPRGYGLLTGGSLFIAGAAMMLAGTAVLIGLHAREESPADDMFALLAVATIPTAAVMTIAGVPMLVVGHRRRLRYLAWRSAEARGEWRGPGFALRF